MLTDFCLAFKALVRLLLFLERQVCIWSFLRLWLQAYAEEATAGRHLYVYIQK